MIVIKQGYRSLKNKHTGERVENIQFYVQQAMCNNCGGYSANGGICDLCLLEIEAELELEVEQLDRLVKQLHK